MDHEKRLVELEEKEADGTRERKLLDGTLLDGEEEPSGAFSEFGREIRRKEAEAIGEATKKAETEEKERAEQAAAAREGGMSKEFLRNVSARDAAERALARIQVAATFLRLQQEEGGLKDVAQTYRSLEPVDMETEVRKRFRNVGVKPASTFSSNLAQVQSIIGDFIDERNVPSEEFLKEEEARIFDEASKTFGNYSKLLQNCRCGQRFDVALGAMREQERQTARVDVTRGMAKGLTATIAAVRLLEQTIEERDQRLIALQRTNALLTQKLKDAEEAAVSGAGGQETAGEPKQKEKDNDLVQLEREHRLKQAIKKEMRLGSHKSSGVGTKFDFEELIQKNFRHEVSSPDELKPNALWVKSFLSRNRRIQVLAKYCRRLEKAFMGENDFDAGYVRQKAVGCQTLKEDEIPGSDAWKAKLAKTMALRGKPVPAAAATPADIVPTDRRHGTKEVVQQKFSVAKELGPAIQRDANFSKPLEGVLGTVKEMMVSIDIARVNCIAEVVPLLEERGVNKALQGIFSWQRQVEKDVESGMEMLHATMGRLTTAVQDAKQPATQSQSAVSTPRQSDPGTNDRPETAETEFSLSDFAMPAELPPSDEERGPKSSGPPTKRKLSVLGRTGGTGIGKRKKSIASTASGTRSSVKKQQSIAPPAPIIVTESSLGTLSSVVSQLCSWIEMRFGQEVPKPSVAGVPEGTEGSSSPTSADPILPLARQLSVAVVLLEENGSSKAMFDDSTMTEEEEGPPSPVEIQTDDVPFENTEGWIEETRLVPAYGMMVNLVIWLNKTCKVAHEVHRVLLPRKLLERMSDEGKSHTTPESIDDLRHEMEEATETLTALVEGIELNRLNTSALSCAARGMDERGSLSLDEGARSAFEQEFEVMRRVATPPMVLDAAGSGVEGESGPSPTTVAAHRLSISSPDAGGVSPAGPRGSVSFSTPREAAAAFDFPPQGAVRRSSVSVADEGQSLSPTAETDITAGVGSGHDERRISKTHLPVPRASLLSVKAPVVDAEVQVEVQQECPACASKRQELRWMISGANSLSEVIEDLSTEFVGEVPCWTHEDITEVDALCSVIQGSASWLRELRKAQPSYFPQEDEEEARVSSEEHDGAPRAKFTLSQPTEKKTTNEAGATGTGTSAAPQKPLPTVRSQATLTDPPKCTEILCQTDTPIVVHIGTMTGDGGGTDDSPGGSADTGNGEDLGVTQIFKDISRGGKEGVKTEEDEDTQQAITHLEKLLGAAEEQVASLLEENSALRQQAPTTPPAVPGRSSVKSRGSQRPGATHPQQTKGPGAVRSVAEKPGVGKDHLRRRSLGGTERRSSTPATPSGAPSQQASTPPAKMSQNVLVTSPTHASDLPPLKRLPGTPTATPSRQMSDSFVATPKSEPSSSPTAFAVSPTSAPEVHPEEPPEVPKSELGQLKGTKFGSSQSLQRKASESSLLAKQPEPFEQPQASPLPFPAEVDESIREHSTSTTTKVATSSTQAGVDTGTDAAQTDPSSPTAGKKQSGVDLAEVMSRVSLSFDAPSPTSPSPVADAMVQAECYNHPAQLFYPRHVGNESINELLVSLSQTELDQILVALVSNPVLQLHQSLSSFLRLVLKRLKVPGELPEDPVKEMKEEEVPHPLELLMRDLSLVKAAEGLLARDSTVALQKMRAVFETIQLKLHRRRVEHMQAERRELMTPDRHQSQYQSLREQEFLARREKALTDRLRLVEEQRLRLRSQQARQWKDFRLPSRATLRVSTVPIEEPAFVRPQSLSERFELSETLEKEDGLYTMLFLRRVEKWVEDRQKKKLRLQFQGLRRKAAEAARFVPRRAPTPQEVAVSAHVAEGSSPAVRPLRGLTLPPSSLHLTRASANTPGSSSPQMTRSELLRRVCTKVEPIKSRSDYM